MSETFNKDNNGQKKILLEVCCGSVDDAVEAQVGGADRIELNSSLFFGGLTPSIGQLIVARRRLTIPICVMIRPRGGGFCYTDTEMSAMELDTRMAIENGADGIVFGILNEDGTIDERRCEKIISIVQGRVDVVFHRAIDAVPDPVKALDRLVNLGIKRVLTKGQSNDIYEGMPLVKKLVSYAGNRIEVMPGGARPYNIADIVERTGCTQIHMASFIRKSDLSASNGSDIFYGGALRPSENTYDVINCSAVRSSRQQLDRNF